VNLPLEGARRSLWHRLISDPMAALEGPFCSAGDRATDLTKMDARANSVVHSAGARHLAVTDTFFHFCTKPGHLGEPSQARAA